MVSTGGSGASSGRVTPSGHRTASRGRWDLGTGDAESVLAEARRAFFAMVAVLVVLWIIQIANWADRYGLDGSYGILPRSVGHLGDIFTAPFLHFSWEHIEGNTVPLFVLGVLAVLSRHEHSWVADHPIFVFGDHA